MPGECEGRPANLSLRDSGQIDRVSDTLKKSQKQEGVENVP